MKQLPLDLNPLIKTYNNLAQPIGVLQSNLKNSNAWIMQHFISVYYFNEYLYFNIDSFTLWECFDVEELDRDEFEGLGISVTDFICSRIEKRRYVYLFLNEKFIPNREATGNYDYTHNLLIFGCDPVTKEFRTAAYSKNGQYSMQDISWEALEKGFYGLGQDDVFQLVSYCVESDFQFEKMDISQIIDGLQCYLNSESIDTFHNPMLVYGISIYAELKKELENTSRDAQLVIMRKYRILYEHKNIIRLLFQELDLDCNTMSQSLTIFKQLEQIFLMLMRCKATANSLPNQKIIKLLDSIEELERKALTSAIKQLKTRLEK